MAFQWLSQKLHLASNPGELHSEARVAAQRFDADELYLLQKTWKDLKKYLKSIQTYYLLLIFTKTI